MFAVRRLVAAAVVALAVLAVMPGSSVGATYGVKATGAPGSFEWDPDFRHITKGNRIRWRNSTDYSHRVVAYRGRWSKETTIAPGESTTKRFRRAGTYKYRCTFPAHSTLDSEGMCTGMCGTIHVTRS